MVQARKIELTEEQTQELQRLRDHATQPYLRVRAAGMRKSGGWKLHPVGCQEWVTQANPS
jgi:hypothetical protein